MIRKIASVSLVSSLLFFGAIFGARAQGDAVTVEIRKLDLKKIATPQYQLAVNQLKGKSRDWLGITTEYDSDALWTDELTFTYYVLVENTRNPKGPKESLFRGKVTYVNVEKGHGHKSDVYLPPSVTARFGDIKKIAVIVEASGKLVAGDSLPKSNQRWWEQYTPTDGMLQNRSQTPFAMINFDDYEMVKPAAGQ